MSLLFTWTLKASLLLALALGLSPAGRRWRADGRHRLLAAAFGLSLLLPTMGWLLPGWGEPLSPVAMGTADWGGAGRWLAAIWFAGFTAHLSTLAAGLLRLRWLAARATPCREGALFDMALDVAAAYRLRRPVHVLIADRPVLPMTWGWREPRVLLPAAAAAWPATRLEIVLRHELAHIRRRDWPTQMLAALVRAIHWYSPLAWLAASRLRRTSEEACDTLIVESGVTPRDYAVLLLELAREHLSERREWAPAPGMARRPHLESRIRALLAADTGGARPRSTAAGLLAVAAAAIGLAGFASPDAPDRPAFVFEPAPAARLTLLLDGRLVDLSKGLPAYPDPGAGLVAGYGWPESRLPSTLARR